MGELNEKYPLALPVGTVLAGQYVIQKVLGQGGFGITYAAVDHKDGRKVAVKEFFPDSMATRTNATTVTPCSGERGDSYQYGKTCFLKGSAQRQHVRRASGKPMNQKHGIRAAEQGEISGQR